MNLINHTAFYLFRDATINYELIGVWSTVMSLRKIFELYLDLWYSGSVFAYVGRKLPCASCQEHWYENTCSRCGRSYKKVKDILGLDFIPCQAYPAQWGSGGIGLPWRWLVRQSFWWLWEDAGWRMLGEGHFPYGDVNAWPLCNGDSRSFQPEASVIHNPTSFLTMKRGLNDETLITNQVWNPVGLFEGDDGHGTPKHWTQSSMSVTSFGFCLWLWELTSAIYSGELRVSVRSSAISINCPSWILLTNFAGTGGRLLLISMGDGVLLVEVASPGVVSSEISLNSHTCLSWSPEGRSAAEELV